jgi:hypothetical protein
LERQLIDVDSATLGNYQGTDPLDEACLARMTQRFFDQGDALAGGFRFGNLLTELPPIGSPNVL